jgi:hypothetical protein
LVRPELSHNQDHLPKKPQRITVSPVQIVNVASYKTRKDDGKEERNVPEPELALPHRQKHMVRHL